MEKPKIVAFANPDKFFSHHRVEGLEKLGFSVVFCENAGEVLELFAKPAGERPDMLITDGLLPHGDEFSETETNGTVDTGAALYKRLRAGDPQLPIIVYTTENRTFRELRAVKDSKLQAIYEFDGNPTQQIFEAASKLIQ